MQDSDKEVIQSWLNRAEQSLNDTKEMVDIGKLDIAQNRLYYSLFYAVTALALYSGFSTSKHSELKGWFDRECIKTGIFNKEYGKLFKTTFDARQKSDYTVQFTYNKDKIISMQAKAKELIEKIREKIVL